jgi:hypothetical protein
MNCVIAVLHLDAPEYRYPAEYSIAPHIPYSAVAGGELLSNPSISVSLISRT